VTAPEAELRIGRFVEAQMLESVEVDCIDESEALTPVRWCRRRASTCDLRRRAGGVSEAAGADNAATSAIAAVCRQQAERRARTRLRAPHCGGQSRSRRQRLPWADLLRRVVGIDVLVCPQCAGPRRVLAAIHDPAAIARVLGALGLTAAGADPAGCRAPPVAAGDAADEGNAAE
jgi:hypothetical protein